MGTLRLPPHDAVKVNLAVSLFTVAAIPTRLFALGQADIVHFLPFVLAIATGGEVIIPTLLLGYGVAIKVAGSLSMMISLPTVLTGLVRHASAGFFKDRDRFTVLILPMGIGSAVGAVIGGLLVGIAPAFALKIGLAFLLIWSSWKVLVKH